MISASVVHSNSPLRLWPVNRAPTAGPPAPSFHSQVWHSGDHSPIRVTSEMASHTAIGDALMSRETSTCFVTLRIVGGSRAGAAWQHDDVVKLVFCLRRRGDLSREEFQRYWRETHAPLVRERSPVLGIRRYVQVHTLPPGT